MKLAVFNLTNEQETVQVDERRDLAGLQSEPGMGPRRTASSRRATVS